MTEPASPLRSNPIPMGSVVHRDHATPDPEGADPTSDFPQPGRAPLSPDTVELQDRHAARGEGGRDTFVSPGDPAGPKPPPAGNPATDQAWGEGDRQAPIASTAVTVEPLAVAPGTILRNRYQLDRQIGSGGSSLVFKAMDLHRLNAGSPDPYVAIKVLKPELRAVPAAQARLKGEFMRLEALAHSSIVRALDLDRDGDTWFLVLELLEGIPLATRIARQGNALLPKQEALRIIDASGEALAFAHQRGHLHLDFKPGNVFLTQTDEIRIIDLGAGHDEYTTSSRLSGTASRQATLAYASPEALAGEVPDIRDDVFSFAALAYELLAGKRPDAALTRPADISNRQWAALRQSLAPQRAARPSSVTELTAAFRSDGRSRRWRVAILCGAAAAAGFLLHGVFDLRGPPAPGNAMSPERPVTFSSVLGPEDVVLFEAVGSPQDDATQGPADEPVPEDIPSRRAATPPAPTVITPDQPAIVVTRPTSMAAIILQRDPAATGIRARLQWHTVPGSAVPGIDYEPVDAGTVQFADNQNVSALYVRLLPRPELTGERTFFVELSSATRGIELGGPTNRIPVTIRDP